MPAASLPDRLVKVLSHYTQQPSSSSTLSEPETKVRRFSILSLLLTLITTINSGHPTLNDPDISRQRLQRPEGGRPHVMEAVLALLVRSTEILACMTYGGTGRPTEVLAVQQGDLEERYQHSEGGLKVAAITNGDVKRQPLYKAQSKGKELSDYYVLVQPGQSLRDWTQGEAGAGAG